MAADTFTLMNPFQDTCEIFLASCRNEKAHWFAEDLLLPVPAEPLCRGIPTEDIPVRIIPDNRFTG